MHNCVRWKSGWPTCASSKSVATPSSIRSANRASSMLASKLRSSRPAFVGCTYSERLVFLELTFIAGRPKDKRLALLAALNRLVVEKVSLRPDDLLVMIYELPGENISFGHGLAQRAHISA